MSKTKAYCQCVLQRLTKADPPSVVYTTSYIPIEYVALGNVLKLKSKDDVWVDGWVIKEIGPVVDAEYVEEHERGYTKQRKASDI